MLATIVVRSEDSHAPYLLADDEIEMALEKHDMTQQQLERKMADLEREVAELRREIKPLGPLRNVSDTFADEPGIS